MSDYLIHYGVPGMKWGVRKDPYRNSDGTLSKKGVRKYEKETKKLNKAYAKYTKKYNKAKDYTINYKLSDEGAKMRLTPTQYARYSSSSARREQYLRMKKLQKGEKAALEQYKKHMNQTMSGLKGSDYSPVFDFVNNTYSLKKNNSQKRTSSDFISTKDLSVKDLEILKEYSEFEKSQN